MADSLLFTLYEVFCQLCLGHALKDGTYHKERQVFLNLKRIFLLGLYGIISTCNNVRVLNS